VWVQEGVLQVLVSGFLQLKWLQMDDYDKRRENGPMSVFTTSIRTEDSSACNDGRDYIMICNETGFTSLHQ
jgi:hypothetical protein